MVAGIKKSQMKLNPEYSMAKLRNGWHGIEHACTMSKLPEASSGQSLTRPDSMWNTMTSKKSHLKWNCPNTLSSDTIALDMYMYWP